MEAQQNLDAEFANITARFDDIDRRQREIARHLREMNGTLRDVVVEIGGVPGELGRDPLRRPIRQRLHDLEQIKYAGAAVGAALGLLFGRITKFVLVGSAVIGAIFTVLRFAGFGG